MGHLHVLRPELHDGFEARVARAGVVDRESEAGRAQPPDDLAERRVVEDDFLLRKLEHDVPVHAAHLGEVAVVQEHRVREKPRRGVHEEALFPRGPGERREDRLDAQAFELEEEVSLARHGEQLVRHLELVPRRPADERLVAEDLARRHADDGLEDRAQLLGGQKRLEPLDERLLLAALAGVGEPGRLGERAHDLPRRPNARVVRNHERGRVNVHEVDRRAPERLLQAASDALAQARGFRLERDAVPSRERAARRRREGRRRRSR